MNVFKVFSKPSDHLVKLELTVRQAPFPYREMTLVDYRG